MIIAWPSTGVIDVENRISYHDVMERTTISIPDELLKRLRVIAFERGTSIAAVVREALDEKVKSYRPRPRSWGVGASGHSDTASNAGEMRPEPRSWR
ncbi:MAG: ribbon-helix-helix protein, CopG family [Chloroflexi bacterium]|nr:ribbon-helix-helix protein, CopG family [Chloroflexota bacterium]